jgi:hypothetical protein
VRPHIVEAERFELRAQLRHLDPALADVDRTEERHLLLRHGRGP